MTYMIECLERAIGKKAIKTPGFSWIFMGVLSVFDPFPCVF